MIDNHTKIESGEILFYPEISFVLSPEDLALLTPDLLMPKIKNISWHGERQKLQGTIAEGNTKKQLEELLSNFSIYAKKLLADKLPHYIPYLEEGRTSLRPAEIAGRQPVSYRKDDSRLHVDAFPSTPNQGKRILRVFSNINPHKQDRVWRVGEPFEDVAKQFLKKIPLPIFGSAWLLEKLHITKSRRTLYDHLMLQIHDRMKADKTYQVTVPQQEMRFPSKSTWIVMTDCTSHAAMSGQHVLEQTYYLPLEAMVEPTKSPLKILEKLMGRNLV